MKWIILNKEKNKNTFYEEQILIDKLNNSLITIGHYRDSDKLRNFWQIALYKEFNYIFTTKEIYKNWRDVEKLKLFVENKIKNYIEKGF